MTILNVEIKAKCSNQGEIREILKAKGAEFIGKDRQVDTYFNSPNARLKLREGNIENNLIFYDRTNQAGPKNSEIILYKTKANSTLKNLLIASMGIKIVVDKTREIYFIDNVKFHLDKVQNLGEFVEIEAIDNDDSIGEKKLREQCEFYINLLKIKDSNLLTNSYSDMLNNFNALTN